MLLLRGVGKIALWLLKNLWILTTSGNFIGHASYVIFRPRFLLPSPIAFPVATPKQVTMREGNALPFCSTIIEAIKCNHRELHEIKIL